MGVTNNNHHKKNEGEGAAIYVEDSTPHLSPPLVGMHTLSLSAHGIAAVPLLNFSMVAIPSLMIPLRALAAPATRKPIAARMDIQKLPRESFFDAGPRSRISGVRLSTVRRCRAPFSKSFPPPILAAWCLRRG